MQISFNAKIFLDDDNEFHYKIIIVLYHLDEIDKCFQRSCGIP